jgi:hypothetical protein
MGIYIKNRRKFRRAVTIFASLATFVLLVRVWVYDAIIIVDMDTLVMLCATVPPFLLAITRRESD